MKRNVMAIKLPYYARSKDAQPLMRCIETAAARAGWRPEQVAVVMSYFFEELVEQVCFGRPVRIPGFGLFGVNEWVPRKKDCPNSFYPAFAACRGWRTQLSASVSRDVPAIRAMKNFRQNHHMSSRGRKRDRDIERPWMALRRMRDVVRAQGRALGIDVPGED